MPEQSNDATPGTILAEALEHEQSRLAALHEVLREERSALLGRDAAAVEAVAARKEKLLTAFRAARETRQALTRGETLEAAIEARDQRDRNGARRRELLALGEACDTLNRENGQLIARLQTHTREALAILRNSDAGPKLYAVDGSREGGNDRQSLGKA